MNKNYKQAVQVNNNVTAIIKLPCIHGVFKGNDGSLNYRPHLWVKSERAIVKEGDWLVEDLEGNWSVMKDNQFKQIK